MTMTYVKHHRSGRVRRFATGSCDTAQTQTQNIPTSDWTDSSLTVGQALADISNGSAVLCDEQGEEITKEATTTPAPAAEWAHFQCLPHSGRTGNYRRVHASCSATDATEILIDGKWEEGGMTLADMRRLMAFGYAEWIAQPDIPTDGAIKAQAQKMLRLMERRGFGPDMQIAQMWDDIDDICGLARSLRLQLIGDVGHTGNSLTNEEHLRIRALLDIVPTRRCFLDTLKMGWAKLHCELSKIVLA